MIGLNLMHSSHAWAKRLIQSHVCISSASSEMVVDAMDVRKAVRNSFAGLMSLVLVAGLMPCIAMASDGYPDSNVPVQAPSATSSTVDVGNVNVIADNYPVCLTADAHAREGQSATLNVHGDINTTGNEHRGVDGVRAYASDKTASVTVDGNVTVDVNRDTSPATNLVATSGVVAYADQVGNSSVNATVNVGGNVKSSATTGYGDSYVYGVNNQAIALNPQTQSVPASTSVTVGGNVTASLYESTSEAMGVYAVAMCSSKSATTIQGGVTATADKGYAVGVLANAAATKLGGPSLVSVSVGKDGITAIGSSQSTGISAHAYDSVVNIAVSGDVTSIANGDNGTATGIELEGDAKGTTDILVDGTITAKTFGVSSHTEGGQYNITVWKIDSDLVAGRFSGSSSAAKVEDKETEKAIKYIIKVEQPTEGGKLTALKADGTSLDQSHDLGIAHWGDKVLLKVDLEPGYRIKGAFNGLDGSRVQIVAASDGNYYLVVPNGGGVYLSVELEKTASPTNGTPAYTKANTGNTMPAAGDSLPLSAGILCAMAAFASALTLAFGLRFYRKTERFRRR